MVVDVLNKIKRKSVHSLFPILIVLAFSGFVHLWNLNGFPFPDVDEAIYSGRAINFISTLDPKDPYGGYDHPYFGQILLAGLFTASGYANMLNFELNYEIIFLIPRIFMGMLAILDTFLIYRIAELRYNRNVGILSAVIFTIIPLGWSTRWVHLESIQLPFTLLSVLIALLYLQGKPKDCNFLHKSFLLIIGSGIFLGLSIFTKIPSFTMIPLVGYLMFTCSKNFKVLGLWFIPVLLIPFIWPLHAFVVGDLNQWTNGIIHQVHRLPIPLFKAMSELLSDNPLLLILALIGLTYAIIKKDTFIILAVFPFLIFMFFINRVAPFHLLLFTAFLSISSSRFLMDVIVYFKTKVPNKMLKILPIGAISIILIIGSASVIGKIVGDSNLQYFQAATFVDNYLKNESSPSYSKNYVSNDKITVISHPFFGWVQKYKFHDNNYIPYLTIPKNLNLKNDKVVIISDSQLRIELNSPPGGLDLGRRIENLFLHSKTELLATFNGSRNDDRIDIFLSDLNIPNRMITNISYTSNPFTGQINLSHFQYFLR